MEKRNFIGHWQRSLLVVAALLMTIRLAMACGGDAFTFAPDGSGTPSLEYVVNTTEAGVGNVTFGANDGTITQTQTLRMDPDGLLLPDNSCSANTAFVLIDKTGILNMQGGGIETVTFNVNGPVVGDSALGGLFTGFGYVTASGAGANTQSILFQSATINPVGTLSIAATRAGDQIVITDSTLKLFIGGGTTNKLNINAGDVQLTNTKLQLDFPANFSAAAGDEFTLMQLSGGLRTGLLSRGNGTALNEGDIVTVNGVDLTITYVGGASGKDILLRKEAPANTAPAVSAIANQTTNEDTVKGPLTFTVNDTETPNALTVTRSSSNTTLLPLSSIVLGGSGTNRTVTLTPAADQSGSADITLTVSDGALTATSQFTLTVNAVNDAPVAQNQSVTTNFNTAKAITLQATDVENSALTYTIVASPTHGSLSGTAPNLTYTPTTNYSGADSFTFRANDGAANSNTATVSITVNPGPAITSFTPTSGIAGTVVTITGLNFTGATQVKFNGTAATFTVNSNTQISATAPAGVTTGKISVTTPDGTATSTANFTVNTSSGNPSVAIDDVAVTEGDSGTQNATFTITLSKASSQTISINAIPSNGSAHSPGDYTSGGARLVYNPGEVSHTFSVPIKGDLFNEINETFFVLLSSPVNCSIGRGRGIGTIVDNDPIPSITIDDVSIGEGNSGQRVASFRLKLSAPSGQLVKATFATADGTASAGDDYVAVAPTQIAFTTGNSFAYARVFINGDVLNEANETFFVDLTSPVAATIAGTSSGSLQALGTILNDDRAPSITVTNVSIAEGNSGTKSLVFKASLSAASGQTVTVKFATADGVARSTSDYAAKNGTLTFVPGAALNRNIYVAINGDTQAEGDETLFLLLSAPTNATIGNARGTGTILNDDGSG